MGASKNSDPLPGAQRRAPGIFPINAAFAVALVLLATVVWVSYRNIASMAEADRWEDQTAVQTLQEEQQTLLHEHTRTRKAEMRKIMQTGVAGCFFGFGALLLVFGLLRKEIAQRTRAEAEAKLHRDHLHDLVKERTAELEQEVSERKRAEEHVERARHFAQGILDNLSDHVAILDCEGKIVAVNAAWRRFGAAHGLASAAVDAHFLNLCEAARGKDSKEASSVARSLRRLLHDRQGEFQCVYPCHDEHEQRWFQLHARCFQDGSQFYVIMAHQNITEMKRAEELLRQRMEEVEKVMLAAPVAILVAHDAECRRITGNHMANEFYEIDHGENMSANPPSGETVPLRRFFRDGRELKPEELPMQLAVSMGVEVRDSEMEVLLPSGKKLLLFGHTIPLWDSKGKVRGCIGAFLDLSERKRGEELLQSQAKHLEVLVQERTAKLQEAIGELEHFSYTITHDMRAPLRAMRGYGDMLLEQNENLSPASRKFIARIRSGAGRMDQLITDALDYSKLVRHQFELSPVDCAALIRGMMESYPQYHDSAISIQGTIPLILGNEAALTQCFSNLLDNALKFVEPGKAPQVCIRAEERGNLVRIWVEDNGIGISEEGRERIFNMFQRLSTAYEGTGIGLALVRKAAERMGGKVGVESEPEHGSRFWLEFRKS